MIASNHILRAAWGALLLLSVCLGGCDTTLEPYSDRYSYSVYGFLSPSTRVQFIRVKPLDAPFTLNASRELDVEVTLENLTAGTRERLKDSVIVFQDATRHAVTHNFWTDTPITRNTRYRLILRGPDGTTVKSTTTTPPKLDLQPFPEQGDCDTLFLIELPGIQKGRQIRGAEVDFDGARTFRLHKSAFHSATENHNATVSFRPSGLFEHVGDNSCSSLSSPNTTVRVQYFSDPPPEEGALLDPRRPLELPAVENGRGFFSGLGKSQVTIQVDTSGGGLMARDGE